MLGMGVCANLPLCVSFAPRGGVVWVAMRPLYGIPLILFWCCVMGGFGYLGKMAYDSRQEKAREPSVVAGQAPASQSVRIIVRDGSND
eukprot:5579059-Amphidinium_carterae.1